MANVVGIVLATKAFCFPAMLISWKGS